MTIVNKSALLLIYHKILIIYNIFHKMNILNINRDSITKFTLINKNQYSSKNRKHTNIIKGLHLLLNYSVSFDSKFYHYNEVIYQQFHTNKQDFIHFVSSKFNLVNVIRGKTTNIQHSIIYQTQQFYSNYTNVLVIYNFSII